MGSNKSNGFKVLMTTDTVGGVWTYTIDLCTTLQPFNVHVILLTLGAKLTPKQWSEVNACANVTTYETEYQLEWMQDPWKDVDESGKLLLQLEATHAPDLIHLNGFAHARENFTAPVVVVAHSDVYSWHLAVKGERPSADWGEYYRRVKSGLAKADMVVAPTEDVMNDIKLFYAVETNMRVVSNGRKKQFFPGNKAPFILTAGRVWDEAKNIELLVRAAEHIPYPIRIAGNRTFQGRTFDSEHPNIRYLDSLSPDALAREMSAASVYVSPAKYEPFGLSVLEAAMSGCALVLGSIDSLKEVWGDNALYIDTNNELELAAVVNSLMENNALRKDYASKALAHAQRFTAERMAADYMEAYRQVMKRQTIEI